MAKRLPTIWPLEQHTTAKHTILRVYLEAWLPIMGMRSPAGYLMNGRLVIVDAFSGPGVYTGGELGSPIIMLNAFLKHNMRDRIEAELVYIFIDEDEKRIERLKEEVAKLGKLPDQVKVDYIPGRYEDEFAAVLDGLEEAGHKLAPTFAFIDPFGYSDAPMSLTGRFLQFDRCEVLIYVPLPDINRFLTRAQQDEAFNSLFGGSDWEAAKPLRGRERLRFLHDLFKGKLEDDCNLDYVRSFQIASTHHITHQIALSRRAVDLGSLELPLGTLPVTVDVGRYLHRGVAEVAGERAPAVTSWSVVPSRTSSSRCASQQSFGILVCTASPEALTATRC